MNVPVEVVWSIAIPFTGATLMWAKSVENRLSKADAVIEKVGKLVDVLLDDRLDERAQAHPK